MKFCIGINLGDVTMQGSDLLGDGVNIAARLQTLAEPGSVCISGSVHDQIRNKLSLTFRSLGEQTYKNISQPVRTFSIVDTEHRALPQTRTVATWLTSGLSRSAAAAALLVLLAGAGYWAYSEYQRSKTPPPAIYASEPTLGLLPTGQRILVDDGTCLRGQIKEVIGGSRVESNSSRSPRWPNVFGSRSPYGQAWIANGDLVVHRVGGVVRVAEGDLRAFLALYREG